MESYVFRTLLWGVSMYEVYARLRDEKGVKDATVAKATGIGKSTFTDWKNGRSAPKDEKLQKIAEYFGVSTDYLRTGKQPQTLTFGASSLMKALDLAGEESQQHRYYTDQVTAQIAEDMATNPNLKMLYDVQRDMDPEDLQAMYNLAMALKRKTERLDSDDPA